MGNNLSIRSNLSVQKCEKRGNVLFLLHRTWTVIVTKTRTTKSVTNRSSITDDDTSNCSCSECFADNFSDVDNYLQESW